MSTATETRPEPTTEAIVSGRRPSAPRRRSSRTNDTPFIGRLFANVFLWGYAVVAIGPLLLMVNNSLRTQQQIATEPLGLPVPRRSRASRAPGSRHPSTPTSSTRSR